jgi:type I restriction-modification system DNA methylase subunit
MPREKKTNGNGANLGFEATLWAAADKLRNNMDAAECKHVVLGLIFLKYISDAFDERHAALVADAGQSADPEDPDEGVLPRECARPALGRLTAQIRPNRHNRSRRPGAFGDLGREAGNGPL